MIDSAFLKISLCRACVFNAPDRLKPSRHSQSNTHISSPNFWFRATENTDGGV